MHRKNLHLIQSPVAGRTAARFDSMGVAFDYFPAFTQSEHLFHTHEFVEMLFVINGTFRHVTADRAYDETSGGLTILNYNQFHALNTPDGPVELINIYWNRRKYPLPDLPAPLAGQLQRLVPAHPMLGHRLNRVFHLQMSEPAKTGHLLLMLYQEQQKDAPGSSAAIDALFRYFLIELCRAAPVPVLPEPEAFSPRIERVRQYLDEHYAANIRLHLLCEIAGLKEANLCRQFKKYTGLSTGDYLKQQRLAAAMQKLRATGEKVLTICHDCGFSDIANFNRTFRAALGTTPSEYRKQSVR